MHHLSMCAGAKLSVSEKLHCITAHDLELHIDENTGVWTAFLVSGDREDL